MTDATPRLTTTEALLVALGLLGLVGTWAQAFGYLAARLRWRATCCSGSETVATPASTFITVDLLVLAAALFV